MSVLDDKKGKNKTKLAFPDDDSIDIKKIPNSLEELKKSGRGGSQAQNSNKRPKGKRGRPKLEHIQEKEPIVVFLTKEQKEELRRRAEKVNLSMTKYIMIKVFGLDMD